MYQVGTTHLFPPSRVSHIRTSLRVSHSHIGPGLRTLGMKVGSESRMCRVEGYIFFYRDRNKQYSLTNFINSIHEIYSNVTVYCYMSHYS